MHSYLKSIGFSETKSQAEIEQLILKVITNAAECGKYTRQDGITITEYTLQTSSTCGVRVLGEEGEDKKFHYIYYFPFVKSRWTNSEEGIYINKRADTEAYTGMCEDTRIGISLIFFLQNVLEYISQFEESRCINDEAVRFSALADEGRIILPTMAKEEDAERQRRELKNKKHLIAEAKKGNQDAIESLTMSDIDKYAMVSERIRREDLLSIVDTSIVPYGAETDMYNIMGYIEAVSTEKNLLTNEEVVILAVSCNNIKIDVSINRHDLLGEPEVGRRFRGNVWLQGKVLAK